MIELYIENRRIDLTDDIEIGFNLETIDADKLSSIKNSFSKTVNIPGTANNNITFGHIFRYDRYMSTNTPVNIGEGYDPHKKVNWYINKNGALINRGYCTLDNILQTSERNITYQITLYGGIGEFFYALSYNDDGSVKTLADLFWNWRPKTNLIGYGAEMTPAEESSETIMNCSADIIANSYHSLNPTNDYTNTTDIDKDVVFVPCYTGLYEDFDSKHMIVSTFNQNYNSGTPYLSADNKANLLRAFPDTYTEDGKVYGTLDSNLSHSGAYRYGLVTFPRDVDPWEAGDLRVNELPVAIRLAKLMHVISQPVNNGGYEVVWDTEIKNTYQWLYGWVLLDKLKQEREKLDLLTISPHQTYDGQATVIDVDIEQGYGTASTLTPVYELPTSSSSIVQGEYNLYLNVYPRLTIQCANYDYFANRLGFPLFSGSIHGANTSTWRYIWTTSVLVHKIYDGNTLIKTIADIFYFSSNPTRYGYGYNRKNVPVNDLRTVLNGKINERFMGAGEFIDVYRYHDCELTSPEVTEGSNLDTVKFQCASEQLRTSLNLNADVTNLRIVQRQDVMWTSLSSTNAITAGMYGNDTIYLDMSAPLHYGEYNGSCEFPYSFGSGDASNTFFPYAYETTYPQPTSNQGRFSFKMDTSKQNGILISSSSGYNILNLTKKLLFANTETPMKYLSSFCKLMNYRLICDNTEKKIFIKTLRNYYHSTVLDISDRVDIGREINIKPITTSYKTINIGMDTPETYPVTLFNRISREKFNTLRYDTGFHYPLPETNLLDDLVYKNTIDWQQASIYYNNNPQMPKPYNTQSVSWTLFNLDTTDLENIEKKEIYTVGVNSNPITMVDNTDFLPKISLFDKGNRSVDIGASLIFLNGFVRNYDYTPVYSSNFSVVVPAGTSHGVRYQYDTNTIVSGQTTDMDEYFIDASLNYYISSEANPSTVAYALVNYFDVDNNFLGYEYPMPISSAMTRVQLNVPANTFYMYVNHRVSPSDTKVTIEVASTSVNYVISPRVSFSNDTVEQYYLNQERCYVYDFKYNDNFTGWGCYSSDQKGSASSWVLPMFSRDLYNVYVQDIKSWNHTAYKFASWNFNNQEGLDTQYSLKDTVFVYDPNRSYSKTLTNESYLLNEYTIDFVPDDDEVYTERIFKQNWEQYLRDLYQRNTRDVTAYVDLTGFGDLNEVMRYIYSWKSHLWIITKVENFRINDTTHDKFTKVRLHKLLDKNIWTSE